MAGTSVFPMVVGATLPALAFTYTDASGNPIALTGYTVAMDIQRPAPKGQSTGDLVTVTASITNALQGQAVFLWPSTLWTTAGKHNAQIVLTSPDSQVLKIGGYVFDVAPSFRQAST